jgi:uncharacterized cupredoxin-like copper-binding protein
MKKLVILFALGLLPVLGACGGGGPSTSIHVTMTDFAFTPNTFTVPAGAQITFAAANNGAVQHDFIIMKRGYQVDNQFTDADQANVYWQKLQIGAGDSVTDSFTAPSEPGEYQIVCGITGHFQAGMVAKLIVVQVQP